MNKFRRITLAATIAVSSLGSVPFATAPVAAATATTSCAVKSVGTQNTVGNPDSRFALNSDGIVTATFKVSGDESCQQAVTLADWQAPNADQKGKPYNEQKLYKYNSGTFGVGTHTLTVQLPGCYYQVDLIRGSSPTDPNGGPQYGKGNLMGSLHGGTQACVITPTPTPPTAPTPTPQTPAAPQQPTSLPNTGAGSDIFLSAVVASALGAAFQYARQFRARRSLA